MKIKRIAASLLAFAITAGIGGNAYAENTGQTMTAEIETAVSDKAQAKAEASNQELEQETESKIVRAELTEQNLPDVIDADGGYSGKRRWVEYNDEKNANSSNILVFHGHGSPGSIMIEQSQGGEAHIYLNNATNSLHKITTSAWSHISFVYFATCKSAIRDTKSGRNSMADEAYKLGADCVIGFKNEVTGAEDFLNYMANTINESSKPISISEAVKIAISKYSREKRQEEFCPANQNNLYIVGDQSICLKN